MRRGCEHVNMRELLTLKVPDMGHRLRGFTRPCKVNFVQSVFNGIIRFRSLDGV
jgi:hypothetical protein